MINNLRLKNGLRVILYPIPYVRSVTIGYGIKGGASSDERGKKGISHFLEHVIFKGTRKYSSYEIRHRIESIGGEINALTGREYTLIFSKVPDKYLDRALDVIFDVAQHPIFPPKEIEKEKEVIIEEIKMYEDSPAEHLYDRFISDFWQDSSFGRSITGNIDEVNRIEQQDIVEHFSRFYHPNNAVLCIVGKFGEKYALDLIKHLSENQMGEEHRYHPFISPNFVPTYVKKEVQQVHFIVGMQSLPLKDEKIYELSVLHTILGGGSTSRLFETIREKEGLVYTIYSDVNSYHNNGLLYVYGATSTDRFEKALSLINEELNKIRQNGVMEEEVYDAKEKIKGEFLLGIESTSSVMQHLFNRGIHSLPLLNTDEILEKIDSVTIDGVNSLANSLFSQKRALAVLARDTDRLNTGVV